MSQAPRRSRLKERSPHPLGLAHTYIRSGPRHTKYVTHAVVGPACLLRACLIFLTSVARPPATRRSLSAPTASSESHSLPCAQTPEGRESRDATREVSDSEETRGRVASTVLGGDWRWRVESRRTAVGALAARPQHDRSQLRHVTPTPTSTHTRAIGLAWASAVTKCEGTSEMEWRGSMAW